MRLFLSYCVLFLLVMPLLSMAQINSDSVLQLEEVVVEINRLQNFTVGSKIQRIDSATLQNYQSNNLGDLLSQQSQIFIKSYGLNNVGTSSARGTSAQHTSVLWNGFSIQSPTLGQSDFSMIPVSSIDELYVQYGGAGALYGSGSIGSTIHLINPAKFDQGFKIAASATASSFSDYYNSISASNSGHRVSSSIKLFTHYGDNNYPYRAGNEKFKLKDASVSQFGLLQENFLKINNDQQVSLRIWCQSNERKIPSMNVSDSTATYNNNFVRLSTEWKRIGDKVNYFLRQAYFNEIVDYRVSNSSITKYQTSISEGESKIRFGRNQLLNLGINVTLNGARSDNYNRTYVQNRLSLFSSYKISNRVNSLRGVLSLRKEIVNTNTLPFTPSIGVESNITKWLLLKFNVSRNYRIPTLNDLYYNPGGNPNLLPESGWSQDLGIYIAKTLRKFTGDANITFFNSNVKNWIIWLPPTGNFVSANSKDWSPQNAQFVWSRGLESSIRFSYIAVNGMKFQVSLAYNYTITTNEKSKGGNDKSLHKQLIFVPLYSGQSNFSFFYKKYSITYNHTYTGNRFTSSDNLEYISGYQLGSLWVARTIQLNKLKLNLSARVNNIWNKSYSVVPGQVMPLRYYQFSINLFYN